MPINRTTPLPDARDEAPPAPEIADLRERNALLTRQRDAAQDEADLLRTRLASVQEQCDEAIAQWRHRCEACLDAQLELAALLSNRPPPIPSEEVRDDVRHIIAQKDKYILHLEALLTGGLRSLLGAWWTLRRR